MWLNARWFFWVLCLISLVLLFIPIFSRDGVFVDGDSYKSLRLSNGNLGYDALSYGGRDFIGEKGWYVFLSIIPLSVIRHLPLLFGFLFFVIFYFLVWKIKPEARGLASLFLVVSPGFIYLFSSLIKYVGAVFFILLGFYLFLHRKNWLAYSSFFISGLFSILSLFLVLVVFLFYGLKKKEYESFFITLFSIVILFLLYFRNVFSLGFPELLFGFDVFDFSSLLSFLIAELGGSYGFGFFYFVLAIVGVYSYYKKAYKIFFAYSLVVIILLSIFYFNSLLFFANLFLFFFAACGLLAFLDYGWKSGNFRFLTILVICCGLLFSSLMFFSNLNELYPTQSHLEAVEFLKTQDANAVVFSDYRNGDLIAYSGKPNFMDKNFAYAPNVLDRLRDMQIFFKTRDINFAYDFMGKNNIRYIFVDRQMKLKIFSNKDQDLLYLLKYSPLRFSLIFSNEEVDVWYKKDYTNSTEL